MKQDPKRKIAIIGASGYGGLQSVSLLKDHPHFEISYLAGNKTSGQLWNEMYPHLKLDSNPLIQDIDLEKIISTSNYAVISLPNGLSSQLVPSLLDRGLRVVDLSADYRYRSLDKWKSVYNLESKAFNRKDNDLCSTAIYGLPEWNAAEISKARLVACPGCFPTASLIPLLPLLKQGLIDTDGIIIDAKSGTSGGGRTPTENLLLSEASETISPYKVIGHRHTSEIEQEASKISGKSINLQFTPHLVPMVRGLLSTIYSKLRDPGLTAEDCQTVLETFYKNNYFVQLLPVGTYPSTKWVRYTNKIMISVQVDQRTGQLILISALDNLLKGQAGQALQILNIMEKIPEEIGLPSSSLYP